MVMSLMMRGGVCPCCAYAGAASFSASWVEPHRPSASLGAAGRAAAGDRGRAEVRAEPRTAPELHIRGVTVVDPRDGSKTRNVTVTAHGGRITAITPDGGRAPAGAQVVEASGKYLVPGYNDMHSHVLELQDPSGSLALMLAEGVTGFRQMSGSPALLEKRQEGKMPIGTSAPQMLQTPGSVLSPFNAGTEAAARAEVRRQQAQGADFIKVAFVTPEAFFAALDEGRRVGIPVLGHLQEGIDAREASARGFHSIEHLGPGSTVWVCCSHEEAELLADGHRYEFVKAPPFKIPFLQAIILKRLQTMLVNPSAFSRPADVERLGRAIAGFSLDKAQALAAGFRADGGWQCPTLVRLRTQEFAEAPEYEQDEMLDYLPTASIKRWREVTGKWKGLPQDMRRTYRDAYPRQLALTKLLSDAGVSMIVGTDGGSYLGPGLTLRQEFKELSEAGIGPLAILQMATVNAATYLGRAGSMGLVEVGHAADMVLLDADPLERVENLHAIAGVVRAGLHHSRRDLDALKANVAANRGYLHS